MKVALAFLPKVRLNKILASFVLNLHLLSVFSFILFVLVFYFIYLFSFLLKCFIVLKEPALTLKRSLWGFTCTKNVCEVKEFWALGLKQVLLYVL